MEQIHETPFAKKLISSSQSKSLSIAFPEGHDIRVLKAVQKLLENGCAKTIALIGDFAEIKATIDSQLPDFPTGDTRITWVSRDVKHIKELAIQSYEGYLERGSKTSSPEKTSEWAEHPANQAAALINHNIVDCALGGCQFTTAEIIRAAIQGVGLRPGNKTISGSFAMVREEQQWMFADCGVVIDPSVDQLVDIAKDTADTFQQLFDQEPVRLAFLSFSTKGSASHPKVSKVTEASRIFKERFPDIISDGELQFDAAILPDIASRKCPHSPVAGKANCFIFPNLDAGNIAYKMAQRLAGFEAYGPILQGSDKPYSDLSRGASSEDIFMAALITMLRVQKQT